jgi:hypothetical protein
MVEKMTKLSEKTGGKKAIGGKWVIIIKPK